MEIVLSQKPKSPIVISGFPGVGMVGAIAAEFLIQHLSTEKIGKIILDKSPALVAIHEGKLIEPFGVYYSSKHNIVVLHSIVAMPGTEWQAAAALLSICSKLRAKELISIEGVGSASEETVQKNSRIFYYTSSEAREKALAKQGMEKLKEGIIMGPTSAVLMKAGKLPVTCFFAETNTNLPDSNAAAQIIKSLDTYLGLKVDYKPLLQLAAKFEEKLRNIMAQSRKTEDLMDKKQMSYVG
ncbi:proteasome assembly chaperone family protein [Candidatus Woesearchaeota archaeon]|nr:proteasome assembly chaperone family protein [Candidatus Woesearchaeota archaeon]